MDLKDSEDYFMNNPYPGNPINDPGDDYYTIETEKPSKANRQQTYEKSKTTEVNSANDVSWAELCIFIFVIIFVLWVISHF